jgi:FKBP-type peptidyl-prolyl cis-trans isomerase
MTSRFPPLSLALVFLIGLPLLLLPDRSHGFLHQHQRQPTMTALSSSPTTFWFRRNGGRRDPTRCMILHSSSTSDGSDTPAAAATTTTTRTISATTAAAARRENEDDEKEPTIDRPPEYPVGSHGELLYALGVNLARQLGDVRPLVETGEELAQLAKGVLDCVVGRLSEEGQKELLQRRVKDLNELVTTRAPRIQEALAAAGTNMLAEMAATEGAITLPEPTKGVVVHVLERGPDGGTRPTRSSSVKIHYHGTLADGTVFDSTLSGDEPVTLPLASVIPGWRDAVLKLREGDVAMVGIPPAHAYGAKGTPDGRIPPNSTIFFKVQLLEILSAGIGGTPTLYGGDGQKLGNSSGGGAKKPSSSSSSFGLLGADGRPM